MIPTDQLTTQWLSDRALEHRIQSCEVWILSVTKKLFSIFLYSSSFTICLLSSEFTIFFIVSTSNTVLSKISSLQVLNNNRKYYPKIILNICHATNIKKCKWNHCLSISVCKSCIVKYFQTSKKCPMCNLQIHETQPLFNLR